jgi:predicted RNA-binding protein with PIN domain
MPYLIDGHNLIGQMPGLSLADPDDEQKLVGLLRDYLLRARKKGTVVFDRGAPGGAGSWSTPALQVVFARPPRQADDLIRDRLRRASNPRGLTVVTADAALAGAARAAGATVLPPAGFIARLAAALPRPADKDKASRYKREGQLTPEEVAAWEAEFSRRRV